MNGPTDVRGVTAVRGGRRESMGQITVVSLGGLMIALKLVRLIEQHSEELSKSLLEKVDDCSKCAELKKGVPRKELEGRVFEVYQHLSDWLLTKTEHDIFLTYTALGRRRFEQGVPFHQFVWGLMLIKQNLWDFMEREVVEESAFHLRGEFELLRMLDQFYDRVMYYSALGYWEAEEFRQREHNLAVQHA
jgi:hypothetical protein